MRGAHRASLRCLKLGQCPQVLTQTLGCAAKWEVCLIGNQRQCRASLLKRTSYTQSQAASTPSAPLIQPARSDQAGHLPETTQIILPPPSARGNPAAWSALLEPCLPTQLRSLSPQWPLPPAHIHAQQGDISDLLRQAKRQAGIDLLVHIGLHEQRWDAMVWLAESVLLQSKTSTANEDNVHMRPFQWPRAQSLEDLTAETTALRGVSLSAVPETSERLHDITNKAQSTAHVASWPQSQKALGQLWQTIGTLVLSASEQGRQPDEASVIMSNALRIIAQLHHQGYIPSGVYAEGHEGRGVDQKPTMISELSQAIMSSLTDAVSDNFHLGSGQVSDLSQLLSLKAGDMSLQLGPELWLEFVLWSCLHGGWLIEAAAILADLRKYKGARSWHLICWQDFASSPREAWSDLLHRRLQAQRSMQCSNFSSSSSAEPLHSIERTVSTEVVVALVDGLMSSIGTLPLQHVSIGEVHERVLSLKSLLERDKMSLGVSSWDEVIARFVDLPGLDVGESPRLIESILELAQTYGKERSSRNVPRAGVIRDSSADYIFSGTASTLGIYHRTLHAHIQRQDINASLRVLALLQSLTDNNKRQALNDFFAVLRSKNLDRAKDVQSMSVASTEELLSKAGSPDFPGFFPSIPPVVLAKLLDLVTESSMFDIGHWMIHTTDVDGPLISQDLYSNQIIAPSVIRYAAATNDTTLLSHVTKTQGAEVSGQTLIALCESRIRDNNWQGATQVLHLMREHSLHEWTMKDLVTLLRLLIQCIAGSIRESSSQEAAILLQKLLRGDLGQVWGPEYAHLDSIVGVISSMDDALAGLCSDMLSNLHLSEVKLDIDCFNTLLEGAVKSYGSPAGTKLWTLWCDRRSTSRQVRTPLDEPVTTYPVSHVAEQFSAGDFQDPATSPPLAATFTGYIKPKISTLRIIVGQALAEAQNDGVAGSGESRASHGTGDASTRADEAREVLNWSASKFGDVFGLRAIDIDAELHVAGMPSESLPESLKLYSENTIKIWRTLAAQHAAWLSSSEQRMRSFAERSDERYMVFDPAEKAHRRFLHLLAADLGLMSESSGDEDDGSVTVLKTLQKPEVPSMTIEEWYASSSD